MGWEMAFLTQTVRLRLTACVRLTGHIVAPRHAVQQRFDLVETSHVKLTALRHVLTSKWLNYSLLSWSIVIGLYALFGGGGGGFGGFFLFYEFFEAQIFLLYQVF